MLFDIRNINPQPDASDDLALCHESNPINSAGIFRLIATKNFAELDKLFPGISTGCIFNLVSDGKWSMIHLLLKILQNTGPADVYATTWSINEDAIRSLIDLRSQGLMTDLKFLFDFRVRKYRPGAYFLAKNHFDCRIASCHAKVTIVMNDKYNVSIIGSPNYTRNDRIEAVVIFENKDISLFHKGWILDKFNKSSDDL